MKRVMNKDNTLFVWAWVGHDGGVDLLEAATHREAVMIVLAKIKANAIGIWGQERGEEEFERCLEGEGWPDVRSVFEHDSLAPYTGPLPELFDGYLSDLEGQV